MTFNTLFNFVRFTWEYYDKTKQHSALENLEPKDFYENYVKPLYNVENKVLSLFSSLDSTANFFLLQNRIFFQDLFGVRSSPY